MNYAESKKIFLTWRDDLDSGLDLPIAVLSYDSSSALYFFQYVGGVEKAVKAGFAGVMEFPDLERVYQSEHLFPIFANRLMSRRRPDYTQYVSVYGLSPADSGPVFELELLGRSLDSLWIF